MRPFLTSYYPSVMFGEGVAKQLANKLAQNNTKSILAVYDTGVYGAGIVSPIIDSLREQDIAVFTFDNVAPDAPDYTIEEGRMAALAEPIDAIVGIGGGSTLDTAKLIATYMEGQTPISLYYSDAPGHTPLPLPKRKVRLYLIPTTAGTGSEVTAVSVVTDTSVHQKRTIWGGASFQCDLAIVDPCLTVGLPPYITATTGLDALAHSLETMTCTQRSSRSDTLCGQSVEYVCRSLPIAFRDGNNLEARSELSIAAWLTLTSDGSRHLGHCVGHAIGARYHLAHGHACALALPAAMRYVSKDTQPEMKLIAQKMNLQLQDNLDVGEQVAQSLEALNKTLGLKTLQELGVDWEDLLQTLPELMSDEKYLSKLDTRPDENAMKMLLKEIYNTRETSKTRCEMMPRKRNCFYSKATARTKVT